MKKNAKTILNILIIFLFISCNNNSNKEELSQLNESLDLIINELYNESKTLEGIEIRGFIIDSVYLQGNQIVQNIEKDNFKEKYMDFCNKYGNSKFEILEWNNKEYLKMQIKMIQVYSLNKEIQYFFQSHFQVDLLGYIPTKKEIQKNKGETIEIIPHYCSSELRDHPIVIIDTDTLEYTGNSYLFKCSFKESGEHLIETETIIKRWNDTLRIKSGFKINVK